MRRRRNKLFIIGACACLLVTLLFITLHNNDPETGGEFNANRPLITLREPLSANRPLIASRESRPLVPTAVTLNDTAVFYDLHEIERREEFTVRRILGRSGSGYLAEVVVSDRFRLGSTIDHTLEIVRLSECLTQWENFFTDIPWDPFTQRAEFRAEIPWDSLEFAAVDERGYLYVLGRNLVRGWNDLRGSAVDHRGDIALYVYDDGGSFITKYEWTETDDFFLTALTSEAHVSGDNIILLSAFIGVSVFTKTGELIYHFREDEYMRFGSGTVSGNYLYGLFRNYPVFDDDDNLLRMSTHTHPYSVRKIEISSGQIIWENSWFEYTTELNNIVFCDKSGLLYLYQTSRLYAYDETTETLHLVKDLLNEDFHRMQSFSNIIRPESVYALSDGRLFFSVQGIVPIHGSITGLGRFREWLFTPLFGEDAYMRMNELALEWENIPVIRFFDLIEEQLFVGTQIDLLLFAEEHGAFADITFLRAFQAARNILFQEYSEVLNTAIFSGMADWDIVRIPPNIHLDNDFSIDAFVERGMLVDLLPFAGNRFVEDDETYYTNLFRALMHGDGLFHVPGVVSVPFLVVPKTHPDLEYLTQRSLDWTWADFLEIVRHMEAETGIPPISYHNAFNNANQNPFPTYVPNPISNVPPFFLFDEDLLFDLGRGVRADEFATAIELFADLVNSEYNSSNEASIFTFACTQFFFTDNDYSVILPMPTMRGEYIFFANNPGYAVLTTGSSPALAAEFIVDNFTNNSIRSMVTQINSLIRPNTESLSVPFLNVHAAYEAIIERVNTFSSLPGSIRHAIHDVVLQYVHGSLSRDVAVERVADIMWSYTNE